MNDPIVSILIPAYNAGPWIRQSIYSAIRQTWRNKEIIVVDDGSTDETASIAESIKCSYLRVVRQTNQGAAQARNQALALAQGNYIQWLDADDLLHPEKLSKQVELARNTAPDSLLSSSFGMFYSNPDRAVFAPTSLWRDHSPDEWIIQKFANNTWMNPAVWLVSRELTEAAGPWNARLSLDDDGEYFCRVVAQSKRVRFVGDARSFYRQWNPSSLSRKVGHQACCSLLESLKLSVGYMRNLNDSERARAAALSYLQVWAGYFYPEEPELFERLNELAQELGGTIAPPRLSFKYRVIQRIFGWEAAKRTAGFVAARKLSARIKLDRLHGVMSDHVSPSAQ